MFCGVKKNSAKQFALPWLSPEELAQVKTVSCIEQALVIWPRVLSQYPLGKQRVKGTDASSKG